VKHGHDLDQQHRSVCASKACAAGSFRRGKQESGDIDVLIMMPASTGTIKDAWSPSKQAGRHTGDTAPLLKRIVAELKRDGFVTDDISLGTRQYHGVARLDGKPFRRLDLLLFPPEDYACALLHFTGSGGFNKQMRLHALEKGFTLNEKGLFRGTAQDKKERVAVRTERDVFDAIGFAWREPSEREMGK